MLLFKGMARTPHKITGELELIDQIRRSFPARNRSVRLGIGDDCAILRPPRGQEVLVTTDFSIEGRHFRRELHPAESVGHRCLARGLSDLAAMGGKPIAAFLSLALPKTLLRTRAGRAWLDGFFVGLRSLAGRYDTALAGGDTSESPGEFVLADIVLVGSVPQGRALRRSTARAGDAIYVTGSLGGAHVELTSLLRSNRRARVPEQEGHPHFFPQPRLAVGAALMRRRLATACIDLSDGLSTDLAHLCESSGVRAEVYAGALPMHSLMRSLAEDEALRAALDGGEDYELLFTAPAAARVPRSMAGVPVTRIGTVQRADRRLPQVTLIGRDGRRSALRAGGWEHFSGR
ncbi:thiamine-phosphate kinase [Edaphobacter flagellatus]|uniref:thiamine-phosphate kinase n=1 Tax=Edaphobacter flagellatus TaxID=1933044 RepID=UPI0021B1F002|nr:thiamine-phosphate kinase [Edaphobacter flagellatus]